MMRSNILRNSRTLTRSLKSSNMSLLAKPPLMAGMTAIRSGSATIFTCRTARFFSTLPGDDSNSYSSNEAPDTDATIRPKLRVKHVLKNMDPSKAITLSHNCTVSEATAHLMREKLSSCLTVDEQGAISGIFTAVDILKFINANHLIGGLRNPTDPLLKTKIHNICTHANKLVYCSPNDTVKRCREIMFQCNIENMPIIENGQALGIITLKHLADSSFSVAETGGKKGFIHNVTGRKGIPEGTKLRPSADPSTALPAMLDIEVSSYALPHPFKRPEGVAMSRRLYGAQELSTDLSVCEDAHFVLRLRDPVRKHSAEHDDRSSTLTTATSASSTASPSELLLSPGVACSSVPSQVYMCIADGVGSWRQYGVDPRDYSHRLVENAKKVIESDVIHRELIGDSPFDTGVVPIHPLDVIMDAWNLTTTDAVNGSSTVCVATLDKKLNQLSYSNIGDCGLLVVRHIDSETAGYMRERQKPRHLRKNDLKVAYISQQQLKSFNLPYQLGYIDPAITKCNFETPGDADTASIPVMAGDIIILATDGLYDNLDLNEIVDEVSEWELQHFPQDAAAGGSTDAVDETARRVPHSDSSRVMQSLAERLVNRARELSLDKNRDSPFAILAKENDIMWGGGMPDDTTVVVGRVVQM